MVPVMFATGIRLTLVNIQIAVHRSLEERLQVLVDSFQSRDPSPKDLEVFKSLSLLLETAKTQTLLDCRVAALFVSRTVPDDVHL